MAEVSLYVKPDMVPVVNDESDAEATRVLGTVAYSDISTYIVALEWYAPVTLPAFADLGLWELTGDDPTVSTGNRLALLTFNVGTMTGNAWNRLNLSTPLAWAANIPRLFQVHTDGHYVFTSDTADTFPFASADGTLHAYGEAEGGNGRWFNGGTENDVATNQHPGGSGYNFFVNIITDVDGGTVSAEIGQVVETGVVQPASKAKIFTLNFATEVGLAQSVSGAKIKSIAQATESGLILPPSFQKSKTINQVAETGTVQSIAAAKAKDIGQVSETGTVFPLGEVVSATIGQVLETGTAFAVSKAKSTSLGQVVATETVQPVTGSKLKTISQVLETGLVFGVTDAGTISAEIGQVLEFGSPGRLGLTPDIDTHVVKEIDRTEILVEAGRTEIEIEF